MTKQEAASFIGCDVNDNRATIIQKGDEKEAELHRQYPRNTRYNQLGEELEKLKLAKQILLFGVEEQVSPVVEPEISATGGIVFEPQPVPQYSSRKKSRFSLSRIIIGIAAVLIPLLLITILVFVFDGNREPTIAEEKPASVVEPAKEEEPEQEPQPSTTHEEENEDGHEKTEEDDHDDEELHGYLDFLDKIEEKLNHKEEEGHDDDMEHKECFVWLNSSISSAIMKEEATDVWEEIKKRKTDKNNFKLHKLADGHDKAWNPIIDKLLQKVINENSNSYLYRLDRVEVNIHPHKRAYELLTDAVKVAIENGKAEEMLQKLNYRVKEREHYEIWRLKSGHAHHWQPFIEALEHNDIEELH